MRKILAGFLATSMIVSMASVATLAVTPSRQAASIVFDADSAGSATDGEWTGAAVATSLKVPTGVSALAPGAVQSFAVTQTYTSATVNLPAESTSFTFSFNAPVTVTQAAAKQTLPAASTAATYDLDDAVFDAKQVAAGMDGATFSLDVNGISYTGKVSYNAVKAELSILFDQAGAVNVTGATITLGAPRVSIAGTTWSSTEEGTWTDTFSPSALSALLGTNYTAMNLARITANNGTGVPGGEKETSGAFKTAGLNINDVVWCDGNGNPMVFTEKLSAVDEDQNGQDGVQSSKTIYFLLRDDANCIVPKLDDDTYWKLKVTKGDNGKYIKNISDVSKNFSNGLYPLNGSTQFAGTVGRHRYIKVELSEIFTDDEYKITLDMRLSAKSKAVNANLSIGGTPVTDDSEIKVKDFYFYMKNLVKDADNDWKVGISGLMLNPLSNDWNNVVWFDEDGDLAHMRFFADSDVGKFYSKLSTKWEHADYASYFNDQDAYIFDFTGSPKLSATSRADLEIYNPFVDEDGNETIDPSTAVIYQVIDGDLFDVTDSFEYKEVDSGDMAFATRTRFLGTYIICEKAVEEAADDSADVPADLVPEDTTPVEVTPGNDNGGKAPANTGKYL